jgi:hypothetical protein
MSVAARKTGNRIGAPSKARRRGGEKGSALIEFLLASILVIFPLLFGTMVFGLSLVRANQVAEVCRDAGHMYAYGVDFSQPGSQSMLVQLAQGLNMTTSGGNGVVILSTVTRVGPNDCVAGGYPSGSCPNLNQTVFTRRIVIGNAQLSGSAFGDPSAIVGNGGNIAAADYAQSASAIATNFSSVIPVTSGQYAYVAETFVVSPDFNFWGGNSYWNWISPGGISARSIF